jgi:sugar/nucleoside kinase (ribokinase family)
MDETDFQIIGLGLAEVDHLIRVPKLRRGGAIVEDYLMQGGGVAATATVAASRLGARTAFCGRVGGDRMGEFVLEEFQREGVNTDNIFVAPDGRTPVSVIHVDVETGSRTMYFYPGDGLGSPLEMIPSEKISSARVLLIDGSWYEGALKAAQIAKESGTKIVAGMRVSRANLELVRLVDALIVNEWIARELAKDRGLEFALEGLAELGPEIVAITMGERGCLFMMNGTPRHMPAFKVDVMDTTGAGDAFHGALAFALIKRWDLLRCFEFASAVAAINCTKLGGRTGLPSYDQVMEFLSERGALEWA